MLRKQLRNQVQSHSTFRCVLISFLRYDVVVFACVRINVCRYEMHVQIVTDANITPFAVYFSLPLNIHTRTHMKKLYQQHKKLTNQTRTQAFQSL